MNNIVELKVVVEELGKQQEKIKIDELKATYTDDLINELLDDLPDGLSYDRVNNCIKSNICTHECKYFNYTEYKLNVKQENGKIWRTYVTGTRANPHYAYAIVIDGYIKDVAFLKSDISDFVDSKYQLILHDNETDSDVEFDGTIDEISKELVQKHYTTELWGSQTVENISKMLSTWMSIKKEKDGRLNIITFHGLEGIYFNDNKELVVNIPVYDSYYKQASEEKEEPSEDRCLPTAIKNSLNHYHEYLEFSNSNNTNVLAKFAILLPWHWAFKQLDLQVSRWVLLDGEAESAKTKSGEVIISAYGGTKVLGSAGSGPALRNLMNNGYSTLPLISDEMGEIINNKDSQAVLRNNCYNFITTSKADQSDYSKNQDYYGFRQVIGSCNQVNPQKLVEGLRRRVLRMYYPNKVSDDARREFRDNYSTADFTLAGFAFTHVMEEIIKHLINTDKKIKLCDGEEIGLSGLNDKRVLDKFLTYVIEEVETMFGVELPLMKNCSILETNDIDKFQSKEDKWLELAAELTKEYSDLQNLLNRNKKISNRVKKFNKNPFYVGFSKTDADILVAKVTNDSVNLPNIIKYMNKQREMSAEVIELKDLPYNDNEYVLAINSNPDTEHGKVQIYGKRFGKGAMVISKKLLAELLSLDVGDELRY